MKRLMAVCLAVWILCGCAAQVPETTAAARDWHGFRVRAAENPEQFSHFSAGAAEAPEQTMGILATAFELYPEGFLEQLGDVEIVVVGELTGEAEFAHGSYAGFTQRTGEGWLMVLSETGATAGTVHHEIGHILDGILTEAGALTEEGWLEFCPSGFVYGQADAECADFFAEEYAMTSIQEDRAATFEAAVMGGEGALSDSPALWLKLEYFSRAVRVVFDTEGWPPKTVWELALG